MTDKFANITWVIKSRKMRWVRHVTCIVMRRKIHKGLCYENMRKRNHLEGLGTDGKNVTEMDLTETEWKGVDWIHLNWPVYMIPLH